MTTKIKGAFKRTLAKGGKGGKQECMHSKGTWWWRFKVAEKNERCIKALSTIAEPRCFQLLSSLGPFECYWPLHDAPSYLNDNNILSEMLMGDKTSAWWSMNDQHHKHGNNTKMNRKRWEILGPPNCRTMAMVINMQTNKLSTQK
jgi:hypothetical protein